MVTLFNLMLQDEMNITVKFIDGEIYFIADTLEEKFTICRLLNGVLNDTLNCNDI